MVGTVSMWFLFQVQPKSQGINPANEMLYMCDRRSTLFFASTAIVIGRKQSGTDKQITAVLVDI